MNKYKYVCNKCGLVWETWAEADGSEDYCCPECGEIGEMIMMEVYDG